MIRNTARRGPRIATSLALAGALALAPTAAFAADGGDATVDGSVAGQATETPTTTAESTEVVTEAPSTDAADAAVEIADPAGQAPATDATDAVDATENPDAVEAPAAPLPEADVQVADGVVMNYVVNTAATGQAAVDVAAAAVVADGGTVLSRYPEIGVLTAQSSDGNFLTAIRLAAGVESAGPTRTAAVGAAETVAPAGAGTQGIDRPLGEQVAPVDPLEAEQWDMSAIGAPEAREITPGDPDVVVGVLDSGIDVSHPDLAGQVDPALSVGCAVNGVPDQDQSAWVPVDDSESHGTHVAGTIAAAHNGVGIVGIAPGVTLASVKVVNYDGYIYPEYALCGFMWAADKGFDVTNNSYYVDPYEFWCQGQADQAPALEAVTRAVEYSETQGVLSVAAAGNSAYDLANKTTNDTSPNDSTPVEGRDVSQGCIDMPAEIDGVITVSALREGADGQPVFDARYSNYGAGVIDLGAPGSGILSTVFGGRYEVYNGTSMASPHVAGVAALLASTHPDATPAELQALLKSQADGGGDPALYGAGVVDAFAAVTEDLGGDPVVAVADGTVQAGKPFRIRGANFVPGETITIDGLDGELVADERGRVDDLAQLPSTVPAGVTTLTLVGSEGSEATLDLLVEAAISGPAITAPVTGAVLEPGTVTVTGTAQPNALVTVVLATADQLADLDQTIPSASARSARVAADPVAYDPAIGGAFAFVQTDATGAFSLPVTGVPVGDFGVTAVQTLTDGTTSAFTTPVLFSVAAVVVAPAPPVVTPVSTGVVPVSTVRATGALAYTGSEPTPFAAAALLMVLVGAATVVATRHRRRSTAGPAGE
ncbi:S8 family serine peptidase [Frigoribacterium sp. R86507]|uniref:S8 family serine peptidase n=1 Tax=Frigoribacterium sp. R86507 TaxID=3093850 RepID=UPI0037C79198